MLEVLYESVEFNAELSCDICQLFLLDLLLTAPEM